MSVKAFTIGLLWIKPGKYSLTRYKRTQFFPKILNLYHYTSTITAKSLHPSPFRNNTSTTQKWLSIRDSHLHQRPQTVLLSTKNRHLLWTPPIGPQLTKVYSCRDPSQTTNLILEKRYWQESKSSTKPGVPRTKRFHWSIGAASLIRQKPAQDIRKRKRSGKSGWTWLMSG